MLSALGCMLMLMQPNGPQPTPPPLHPNAYSFITDHNKPGKRSLLPTGGSKQSRIMMVVGIVLAISIVGVVIMAVLNGIDNSQKQDWLTLAQKQQEIIRISEVGATKAQGRDTKNLATTTKLTLESSQALVNKLAKSNGANVSSKALLVGKNAKTDADLKTAEQTNQFDTAFQDILKNELNEYQALLKKLHDGSKSKTTKAGLSSAYNNANILATQANQ